MGLVDFYDRSMARPCPWSSYVAALGLAVVFGRLSPVFPASGEKRVPRLCQGPH